MKDISYHILDIVQNSLHAGASHVVISISEQPAQNRYELIIEDNGHGIEEEMLEKVTDPFFSAGKNKRIGLGLPLLKQNAEQAGGYLHIRSQKQGNTVVQAIFQLDHIDRIPEGHTGETMRSLIAAHPGVDFIYRHRIGNREWEIETAEIRDELFPVPVNTPEVLKFIADNMEKAVADLRKKV